jgi:MFS family permease
MWPLVAICVGYFMVILDTTVVNVALPALSRGLHTTTSGLQWVIDGYILTFAALLLSAGALGDRRGAKPHRQPRQLRLRPAHRDGARRGGVPTRPRPHRHGG